MPASPPPSAPQLLQLFLAAVRAQARAAFRSGPELDAALERVVAEARAGWPKVALELPGFIAHVARHADTPSTLGVIRGADLYLAFACAQRHPWAIDVFVRRLLPKAVTAARAVSRDGRADDDVRQMVSVRMLVGERGDDPKVAQYAGQGPLENWVRSAAIRTAQNWVTRQPPGEPLDGALELPAGNPELDFLKQRYRRDFKLAFEAAIRQLPAEDLNLVRLHVIDKLSIDRLSALYQIHRATAARRIARARQFLADETEAALTARLGLKSKELASLMRLVRSNVDLSLARLLRPGVS